MSSFLKIAKRPRNIAIAGGIAGAVLLLPRTQKKASEVNPIGGNSNVFNTPAVQNVGDRFSAGGGTQTHTPAIASPKNVKDTSTPHEQKGVGTAHFDEHQMGMRPEKPSVVGKAFSQAHLGNDKGK